MGVVGRWVGNICWGCWFECCWRCCCCPCLLPGSGRQAGLQPSATHIMPFPLPLQAMGRTRHNKLVYFPGSGAQLKGQLVQVAIDRVHAYTLYGSLRE